MQLNDEQKREVARWIEGGAKLSEVQQRLGEEFGVRLTYMEARFLVDDLSLVPQEKNEPAPKQPEQPAAEESKPTGNGVCVEVDAIQRPGALVSGSVTFSDGMSADWSLDQSGRFGMLPAQEGYRPSQADLAEFRKQLERELQRKGM